MNFPAGHSARAWDLAQWHGWRRLGVAGGSVALHVVILGLIVLSLGASRSEEAPRETRPDQPMALDFVMLDLPPMEALPEPVVEPEVRPEPPPPVRELPALEPPPVVPEPEPEPPKPEPQKAELPPAPTPDPPRPEPPKPEPPKPEPVVTPEPPRPQAAVTPAPRPPAPAPTPVAQTPKQEPPKPAAPKPAPVTVDPKKDKNDVVVAAAPSAPAPAASSADAGGVFIPPSTVIQPGGGPAGLRGLAYGDPCESRFGKKPKECVDDWRGRVGTMDSMMPRSKDDLKQHFADYITPCPNKVGCEGGEWISTNGTRAPSDNTSAASGGAASVGGINDVVGRLPQKPDFVDPGFGD